jgi:hypothetical protein
MMEAIKIVQVDCQQFAGDQKRLKLTCSTIAVVGGMRKS